MFKKLSLKFKDKLLEKEFIKNYKKTNLKHTQSAIIVAIVMFYLFHFIDHTIVKDLNKDFVAKKQQAQTIIENELKKTIDNLLVKQVLQDNIILHNDLTSPITSSFEKILLQNKKFNSEVEKNIWKIRINTIIIALILLGLTYTKKFAKHTEIIAAIIGILGGVAISVMISYVNTMASYIYLSGFLLVIIWLVVLSRIRFIVAFYSVIIMTILNNIITSNELLSQLLHNSTNLVGDLLLNGTLTINLSINNFFIISTIFLALYATYTIEKYARINFLQNKENEKLLLNILPKEIAEIKKKDPLKLIAKKYKNTTILFTDLVGFTKFSNHNHAEIVVKLLNKLYSKFDKLTKKYKVEKIKTIGDAYMVVAGIPNESTNHAKNIADFALELLNVLEEFNKENNINFALRIGINSGEIVAGVVGELKYAYDVWGDSVNTASRMESKGLPGKIQVSPSTYELLKDDYVFEKREDIQEFKGLGKIQTYFLLSKKKV